MSAERAPGIEPANDNERIKLVVVSAPAAAPEPKFLNEAGDFATEGSAINAGAKAWESEPAPAQAVGEVPQTEAELIHEGWKEWGNPNPVPRAPLQAPAPPTSPPSAPETAAAVPQVTVPEAQPLAAPQPTVLEKQYIVGRAFPGGPMVRIEVAPKEVPAAPILESAPSVSIVRPESVVVATGITSADERRESQHYQIVEAGANRADAYAKAIQFLFSKPDAAFNEISEMLMRSANTPIEKLAARNDLFRLTGRGGEFRIDPVILSGADATMENRIRMGVRAFNQFAKGDEERKEGTLEIGGKHYAFTIGYVDSFDHDRIAVPNGEEARVVNVREVR